jgi:hypothetical protein
MIHEMGHAHPVAFEDDDQGTGGKVFVEHSTIVEEIEPLDLSNDDEAERDAALRAIHWLLDAITGTAIVAKVLALRYVFRIERRNMDTVAKQYGFAGRATISKHVVEFSDALGVPAYKTNEARDHYSHAQVKAWEKRPRHNKPRKPRPAGQGSNGNADAGIQKGGTPVASILNPSARYTGSRISLLFL